MAKTPDAENQDVRARGHLRQRELDSVVGSQARIGQGRGSYWVEVARDLDQMARTVDQHVLGHTAVEAKATAEGAVTGRR